MNHTPGPWRVEWRMESERVPDTRPMQFHHFVSYEIVAAGAPDGIGSDGEVESANARLIAAAPKLAEALRAFVAGMDPLSRNLCPASLLEAADNARALLARLEK